MQLDRIAIAARTRTPWEAIDLGFVMARAWWRPLFLSWLLPSLSLLLLLNILFPAHPWWVLLAVWWLKPLWDCAPLYIGSRKLFGDEVGVGNAMRHLGSQLRPDWIAWLTWRRFSFTRSLCLPVTSLERLKGKPRSQRVEVLQRRVSGAACALTILGFHLEQTIALALAALMLMLLPESVEIDWLGLFQNESLTLSRLGAALTYLAMALMAPFYSMAGFALYISRRIDLEAWDIEIRFRHLAQRLAPAHSSSFALLGTILLAVALVAAPTSYAQEPPVEPQAGYEAAREQAREAIAEIVAGEDFHRREIITGWRAKSSDADDFPEWLIKVVEFLERNREWLLRIRSFFGDFAAAVEFTFWVLAASLLIYLLYRYRRELRQLLAERPARQQRGAPVTELFGLDLRQGSLPERVTDQVLALWQAQRQREAIGLLYRATLSKLINECGYVFRVSQTEAECCRQVLAAQRGSLQANSPDARLLGYLPELTRVWQALAYAHRLPGQERVLVLCSHFDALFATSATPLAASARQPQTVEEAGHE